MASPAVRSVGAQVIATTDPISIPIPGTTAAGDLILAVHGIANNIDRSGSVSGGSSGTWVEHIQSLHTRGAWYIDRKFVTGPEAAGNYSAPASSSQPSGALALAVSGADPTNPIWPTISFADATTADTADVSLTGLPECLLVYAFRAQGAGSSSTFATPPDVGGTQMTRQTNAASQNFHVFTLPFAGGDTGVVDGSAGGTHRAMLFAVVSPGATEELPRVIVDGVTTPAIDLGVIAAGARQAATQSVIAGGARQPLL